MSTPPCDIEFVALTIDELLSSAYEVLPEHERDAQLAQQRLARWIAIGADGVEANFAKRLARENRSREWMLERLGGVRRRAGFSEPDWVGKTRRVFGVLTNEAAVLSPQDELAFAPLLAPLVDHAASALRAALPEVVAPFLTPAVFDGVVDHLRRRLSNLCELPFYEVLLGWRRGLVAAARTGDEAAGRQLLAGTLEAFAVHLRGGGYADLLREKPILFRLLAMLVDQWHNSYLTFFMRFAADRQRIAQFLAQPGTNPRVRRINWGASDPHNGGHSVFVVEFEDGHRVLYKPKDLRPDRFVASIVAALGRMGLPEPLVVPEALACDGYGWTRFIESAPCADEREVARYYRRFGAWLAVFHVLSTSDMHMENFIAQGGHPVPVDFEMVLQGLRQLPKSVDDDTQAHWLAARFIDDSVQSVGMPPAYVQGQDGSLISMGALEPSVYPVQVLQWDDVNTPRMLLRSATEHIEIATNLPTLDGQPVLVARFRDAFLSGFGETMHFVSSHRDAVLAAVDAAEPHRLTIRKVVRPTRFYYMLLKRLYDHRNMKDSVAWSLEADFVARLFDWDSDNEEPWKLAGSERRQLHELGIPHFTMQTASNIIGDRDGPVTRLHVDLGLEVTRSRLAALSPATIDVQADIVRACLQMPQGARPRADDPVVPHAASFAEMLRNELLRHSFRAPRSIAWMGLNRVDHEVAAQLGPLGHDLYHGSAGIALFLAALAKDGDPCAAEQCRQALGATIKLVNSPRLGPLGRALGVGGAVGLGSIVYALAFVSDMLSDGAALEAAEACARGISPESIRADDRFDLVAGTAGACLALLALHRRTGAAWPVERAVLCGDHLLDRRSAAHGMWISSAFAGPLTGVAHGAAGMALALSRLYAVTGKARFRQAAQDCVEFENRHFDVAQGNWTDLRAAPGNDMARTPNQWCYGAPGIGLARLAMRADGAVPKHLLDQDVERALAATLRDPGGRSAGLCCGDGGHIEFLSVAAATLDRPPLRIAARERLARLQATWDRTGDLNWIGGTSAYNPGLFQGLAGVGFSALRVDCVQLPSPLVWE
jgi:type 2 lantibiotic biosynthesis protein LanM